MKVHIFLQFFHRSHDCHCLEYKLRCLWFLIGPTLLVSRCVEAISIHVVTVKWLDPMVKAVCNMSQLLTHRRIGLSLQGEARYNVIWSEHRSKLERRTKYDLGWTGPSVGTKKWNQASLALHRLQLGFWLPGQKEALAHSRTDEEIPCTKEKQGCSMQNSVGELNEHSWELTPCTAAPHQGW
jgi:hypothetical protein